MTRLISTIRWDIQLQIRNGFYYVAAFMAVFLIGVLWTLSDEVLSSLLPALVFENIFIGTFFFMAGLLLLEKGEGTLEGLITTPLRQGEYLLSKLITLTLLAVLESLVVIIVVYGLGFNILLMILGIVLLGTLYALLGFILVIRYDSINSFLLPAIVFATVFFFSSTGSLRIVAKCHLIPTPDASITHFDGGQLSKRCLFGSCYMDLFIPFYALG